ncbi:MAG: PQQ-like beta-propeller repeat protein [Verrucomicrobia bacterium]|nr:PQQ-like beta-propeller repeat protein [Verrucomicrobiota bacterium]
MTSRGIQSEIADATRPHSIRWWPAFLILALAAVVLIWIWVWYGVSRQDRNIATVQVIFFTLILLLLWVVFFSRFRPRIRRTILAGVFGLIISAAGLFRIRGVTGDLLPILEFRWKPKPPSTVPVTAPGTPGAQISPSAFDYPQFLGPFRNATVSGPKLERDWTSSPPASVWRQPIGPAWSGFAILGHHAVTQEQHGEDEMVVCYDLLTGKVIWSHADKAHYHTTIAGEGPRATPTLAGNRVYSLGATGILNCLDLAAGRRIWSKDIIQENQSRVPDWGLSGSPLVVDHLVVVSAGGHDNRSLVACDKENGQFVWGGGSDGTGYSSPYLAMLGGTRQILIFNSSGVAAHAVDSGRILWEYPWPGGHPHVALPVVLPDNQVLVSSGYGTGSELLRILAERNWLPRRVWKSTRLKAKFTNVVYRDGFIYGLDDGILVCLDASDGSLKWKEGRYGHGQVILNGDLLLLLSESGEVVLLEPVPAEHRKLAAFPALEGKTWNPPALAGEFLLVRNDKEAACYRMPVVR